MIADYYAEIKMRSSNPFRNANVTNEDRRQIAAKLRQEFIHSFILYLPIKHKD